MHGKKIESGIVFKFVIIFVFQECGCECKKCVSSENDVHLHVEIENLKQRLVERDNHIVTMETNFLNEANKFPSGEVMALREELLTWQDKYKRYINYY